MSTVHSAARTSWRPRVRLFKALWLRVGWQAEGLSLEGVTFEMFEALTRRHAVVAALVAPVHQVAVIGCPRLYMYEKPMTLRIKSWHPYACSLHTHAPCSPGAHRWKGRKVEVLQGALEKATTKLATLKPDHPLGSVLERKVKVSIVMDHSYRILPAHP